MKKQILFVTGLLALASVGTLNAQASCDTIPDPGQTVGKCLSGTTSQGDYAFCSTTNEGPICYFGEPTGDPKDPTVGG